MDNLLDRAKLTDEEIDIIVLASVQVLPAKWTMAGLASTVARAATRKAIRVTLAEVEETLVKAVGSALYALESCPLCYNQWNESHDLVDSGACPFGQIVNNLDAFAKMKAEVD